MKIHHYDIKEEAVLKLLKAIEHIQLPFMLNTEQANTYNELMYAIANVKTVFKL